MGGRVALGSFSIAIITANYFLFVSLRLFVPGLCSWRAADAQVSSET